ncbi:MAG: T9SS type A sorting domain-containing protein [Bacteroidota bacterium]
MQKRATLTILFYLCFLLSPLNLSAQTRIIAQAEDGAQTVHYYMDDELNVYFNTPEILIANLATAAEGYTLPAGSAPMFLEFKINGVPYEVFPLEVFEFSHHVNGYPVFHSLSEGFSVNFAEICPTVFTGTYIFQMTWSIVTQSGEVYPIHNLQYSNPNGIFSCQVFTVTCPNCALPPKSIKVGPFRNLVFCPPISPYNTDPVAHMSGTTDCASSARPGHSTDPSLGDLVSSNPLPSRQSTNTIEKVNISPNPFGADFQLSYQLSEQSEVKLVIFSSNGQMVYQNTFFAGQGHHDWTIDTQQWPVGIYHCQLQTARDHRTLKLVKSY